MQTVRVSEVKFYSHPSDKLVPGLRMLSAGYGYGLFVMLNLWIWSACPFNCQDLVYMYLLLLRVDFDLVVSPQTRAFGIDLQLTFLEFIVCA